MPDLTIGQLAERTGTANSALRYWEDLGLISSVRTAGNQRRYERATIRRVSFIRAAQRVGLSLDEIAGALSTLPEGRTPTATDWARLSRAWRGRLDEQIRRIEKLRDQLDSCIGCGCLSLRTCALNNPSDVLAGRGPRGVLLEPVPPAPAATTRWSSRLARSCSRAGQSVLAPSEGTALSGT